MNLINLIKYRLTDRINIDNFLSRTIFKFQIMSTLKASDENENITTESTEYGLNLIENEASSLLSNFLF